MSIPNPSTHCLRVKLTGENLFDFQAELFENCGSYEDAGRELRSGKAFVNPEARVPESNPEGTSSNATWTARQQEDYKRALADYAERERNYKRHKALLFTLITNSMSQSVLQRMRLQPQYKGLLDQSHVLGLWNLIQETYMSVSGNSIAQLRNKWQNLSQVDRTNGREVSRRSEII